MRAKQWIASIVMVGVFVSLGTVSSVYATINNASIGIVSESTTGDNPNAIAQNPALSGNGRYVAFQSRATNVVSASTNGEYQIYVKDKVNSETKLVSVSLSGTGGNRKSENPRITSDGRYVVFESIASDLVAGDTNNKSDIFRSDLQTGTILRVSTSQTGGQINDDSAGPDISSDGDRIVFHSFASTLLSGISPTNYGGIYVKDVSTGLVRLLSRSPVSQSQATYTTTHSARISCDGQTVVFDSAGNNIVEGDAVSYDPFVMAPRQRIYVVDMNQSPLVPMYINPNTDSQLNASPSISCDGNYIAFLDGGRNIVPSHYSIGNTDVYVYNRATGEVELASLDSDDNKLTTGTTLDRPSISNDGNFVLFSSLTFFDSQDYNMYPDVFLRDRLRGTTELLSRNSNGDVSDARSFEHDISADGHSIAFRSNATNLVSNFGANYGLIYGVKNEWISAPSGLHATTPSTQASLSWSAIPDASSYDVYRDDQKIATSNTNTYVDSASSEGSHTYYVVAVGDGGVKSVPSSSVSVLIDKSNPNITASVNTAPNGLGWNNTPVTITFQCSDTVSGVESCTSPITVSSQGIGQQFTGTAVDNVGNTSTTTVVVSIDATKPTIVATRSPGVNANGWNNSNVTVAYTCADSLSGIASCSSPTTLTTEANNLSATGTVVDNADNTNSVTMSPIKIDKTAPTATNATMSNTFILGSANVTLGATVADSLSGVAGGEFYIDTDPGQGNGTSMTYNSGKLNATKTVNNLSLGQHRLYIRSKDTAGNWSTVTSITFIYI
ncbi:PD40 domain-containing protein [Candidatus Saccharibacteria bacterium]|nr:PD40 domain-containing protein [Candidatus Saccharibacteria bacterium]